MSEIRWMEPPVKEYSIEWQIVEVNRFGENIGIVASYASGYMTSDLAGIQKVNNVLLWIVDPLMKNQIDLENLEEIDT